MYKPFCTIIFLLICTASYSQTGKTEEKTYLNYYQEIAVAEDAVVNGQYLEGINQYQKTFAEYPYNNPIDCYVAAQVASYAKDTTSSIYFLLKGIRFGVPVYTIINNPHLAAIFSRLNKRVVDSCLTIYENSINKKARAETIAFYRKEQFLKMDVLKVDNLYGGDGILKSKYKGTWDSLLQEIMLLTKKYGFPAQKIIGTQNGEDSLLRLTNPHSTYAFFVFVHHHNAWSEVGTILWAELLKGNITPQMYAVIYENSNGKKQYSDSVIYIAARPCGFAYCRKQLKKNLQEINRARNNIGLCSYEVMEKKFASRQLYYQWRERTERKPEPLFDFQCDFNFQRKY